MFDKKENFLKQLLLVGSVVIILAVIAFGSNIL